MMTLRLPRHPSTLPMLAVVTLLVSACESACLQPPCPLPVAVTATVTSSVTGGPVAGAFVQQDADSNPEPCMMRDNTTTCTVFGGAGTYSLTIGAPGYQSVQRTVVVPAGRRASRCGCDGVDGQAIDAALAPVA